MPQTFRLLKNIDKARNFSSFKRNFAVGKIIYNKPSSSKPNPPKSSSSPPSLSPSAANVPGLSRAVLHEAPRARLTPGIDKNGAYKNPEYFCYDKTSYFEAEIEILKYRCPQPSVKIPFVDQK